MRKRSLFFVFVIFSLSTFSQQVVDNAHLKCQYNHTWQFDTLENIVRDDLLILQIGENMSKSYSYYTFQYDSLNSSPKGRAEAQRLFIKAFRENNSSIPRNFPHKRMKSYIYKNYPQGKMTVTDGLSLQDYIYEDELNAQNWQFTDSTKTILNYSCQMATCDFRGRTWTAWFAPDIPISDGPWKFGGLPGLIMEAYDRGKQYYFVIVGLEQVADEPIVFSELVSTKSRFRNVNRRELLKAKMHQLTNSASMMEMETGVPFGNNKPVYMDLIERDYR